MSLAFAVRLCESFIFRRSEKKDNEETLIFTENRIHLLYRYIRRLSEADVAESRTLRRAITNLTATLGKALTILDEIDKRSSLARLLFSSQIQKQLGRINAQLDSVQIDLSFHRDVELSRRHSEFFDVMMMRMGRAEERLREALTSNHFEVMNAVIDVHSQTMVESTATRSALVDVLRLGGHPVPPSLLQRIAEPLVICTSPEEYACATKTRAASSEEPRSREDDETPASPALDNFSFFSVDSTSTLAHRARSTSHIERQAFVAEYDAAMCFDDVHESGLVKTTIVDIADLIISGLGEGIHVTPLPDTVTHVIFTNESGITRIPPNFLAAHPRLQSVAFSEAFEHKAALITAIGSDFCANAPVLERVDLSALTSVKGVAQNFLQRCPGLRDVDLPQNMVALSNVVHAIL